MDLFFFFWTTVVAITINIVDYYVNINIASGYFNAIYAYFVIFFIFDSFLKPSYEKWKNRNFRDFGDECDYTVYVCRGASDNGCPSRDTIVYSHPVKGKGFNVGHKISISGCDD